MNAGKTEYIFIQSGIVKSGFDVYNSIIASGDVSRICRIAYRQYGGYIKCKGE